jgi:hypothetical protein
VVAALNGGFGESCGTGADGGGCGEVHPRRKRRHGWSSLREGGTAAAVTLRRPKVNDRRDGLKGKATGWFPSEEGAQPGKK